MGGGYAEERWVLIDRIQDWFLHKNQFWLVISVSSLGAILALEAILYFASQENPAASQDSEFLVIPLLGLFVMGTFWRSLVHSVLAFSGAVLTYGGVFFLHTAQISSQLAGTYVANRLGYGIHHAGITPPDAIAERYLIVGIFALLFCIAIALRPDFFRSKNYDGLPYPVWKGSMRYGGCGRAGSARLISLAALLSYEEQHAVARYKFIVAAIDGRKYLVTPYDWIPEDSVVIRDESSNSIIGIP